MNIAQLKESLTEKAEENITENWTILEHASESLELRWTTKNIERNVICRTIVVRNGTNTVSVETACFFDDENTNERYWTGEDIANVNENCTQLISNAIETAITQVEGIEKEELEFIDTLTKS
jgi:hypothetical protein